jgi:thiamine-phosphate pyrophosphorylase
VIRYAITDRLSLGVDEPTRRAALLSLVKRWAAEGIDYIQLREKDLSVAALEDLACAINAILFEAGARTRLLINSSLEAALAANAAGLHLTAAHNQPTFAEIRELFAAASRSPILSISCHTLAEVARARHEQVDLILFGPVFGKTVAGAEVTPAAGLEALHAACQAADGIPVLALGGVTEANTAACLAAGAAGIAGIRLFAGNI